MKANFTFCFIFVYSADYYIITEVLLNHTYISENSIFIILCSTLIHFTLPQFSYSLSILQSDVNQLFFTRLIDFTLMVAE